MSQVFIVYMEWNTPSADQASDCPITAVYLTQALAEQGADTARDALVTEGYIVEERQPQNPDWQVTVHVEPMTVNTGPRTSARPYRHARKGGPRA